MSKVVLITGASSGIGKSIGEFLLKKKFKVYGTSRNPSKYIDTKIKLIKSNINSIDEIDKCVKYILMKEGTLDVLINNAGIGFTGPIEESNLKDMERLFMTNFFGPLELIKKVLPIMRKNNYGLIINITSIAGYIGLPFRGVFCASKSALEILTESLRSEVKDYGIKISNVAPGDIKTDVISRRIDSFNDKDSVYFNKYFKTYQSMNKDVELKGADPIIVAKKIYRIIKTKNPKIHYVVGKPLQKFSIILKKILPDLWFEYILNKFNKL